MSLRGKTCFAAKSFPAAAAASAAAAATAFPSPEHPLLPRLLSRRRRPASLCLAKRVHLTAVSHLSLSLSSYLMPASLLSLLPSLAPTSDVYRVCPAREMGLAQAAPLPAAAARDQESQAEDDEALRGKGRRREGGKGRRKELGSGDTVNATGKMRE